ncbi:ATP-binding protein [Pedobacter sp. Du54]|uniref:ATP-binding protein n=1 Tax=Pedobacter anseongensis TaxID=3133439 RepID=UPI0030ADCAFB
MLKFINIEERLTIMLAKDSDPFNIIRAKFLAHATLACICITLFTIPTFYLTGKTILFVRSLIIFLLLLSLLYTLFYTSRWKIAAHTASIMLTFIIWSNIFFFIKGVNILSIQFTLLLIVLSYYLLGSKWGMFYSALTVIPMLLYFTLRGHEHIFMQVRPIEADSLTFSVVFVFNFSLIIYLQYHFFNSFNIAIQQLSEKRKEEKLLNEKLKEAIIQAEQSSKAKSNFLSTISHELRTPLNGVIGMSDILLMQNPREDQAENLNVLKFSANNLLNLINNVLDYNKIDLGKVEIESIPFKIYDLIRNIYSGFRSKAEEKELAFTVDIDEDLKELSIIGDPTRLTQILVNLIENAIKFTAKGKVNVIIKSISKTPSTIKLHFNISDTGIGIPTHKQTIIFDSFTQSSNSTTRKYGGTGLGLAIVKNLLTLMGSEVITKSKTGSGTSFTFELIYTVLHPTQKAATTNNSEPEEIDISTLRILIAEDNEMNTLVMKKLLTNWKINPHFAINGAEALSAFENNDFDVVLMDIHMPIMDGYEAAMSIRRFKDPKKAKVTIIALTASVALDVRNKVAAAGIDDFMSKPFNTSELRRKLEEVIIKKG